MPLGLYSSQIPDPLASFVVRTPQYVSDAGRHGDPVLAADVKHSFDSLTGPQSAPQFRSYFADVRRATVLGERLLRFDFVRASGFRSAFEAKGRFNAHMKGVPTVVITHPNPGLLGAAAHLRQQLEQPSTAGQP